MQLRLIERLLNTKVDGSGNVTNSLQQPVCEFPIFVQVVAEDLDIDGRRQTKIQNLAHDVRRQESERNTRKFIGEANAQIVNVFFRRFVLLPQAHENVGVRGADR